jgi:hypothetical protein
MAFQARASLLLALVCAALSGASAAEASVFAVVRSQPDAVTVIDPAAIEPVAGNSGLRRAWSVTVQKNLVSGGPQQPGYVRTLNEYDCAKRKIRWARFDVYSRFGASIIHKDNDTNAWNDVAPDSEADASIRLVCDHSNRWAAIASQSVSQLVLTLMRTWDEAAPMPPLQPVAAAPPAKMSARKKPRAPKDKPFAQR